MKIYIALLVTASIRIGDLALSQLFISIVWILMIHANNIGDNYHDKDSLEHDNCDSTHDYCDDDDDFNDVKDNDDDDGRERWARGCEFASEEQSMLRQLDPTMVNS